MNHTDIDQIIKNQINSSQIGLVITSICFQLFIFLGYIRSILLKDKELSFFIVPLLFIALLMISISFGIRKNNSWTNFLFYLIITVLLSILFILHFFKRRFLKYKVYIHNISIILLISSIVLSFIILI